MRLNGYIVHNWLAGWMSINRADIAKALCFEGLYRGMRLCSLVFETALLR